MMLIVVLCLCGLIPTAFAGAPMVEETSVIFHNSSDITAKVNDSSLTFQADFFAPDYLIFNVVEARHRNVLTSEETLLGRVQDYNTSTLTVPGYTLTTPTAELGERLIRLVIDSVQFRDDGVIFFNVLRTDGSATITASRNLTVQKPLDSLVIQVNNVSFSFTPTETFTVPAGNATVMCKAVGSSPATTDISLALNGANLPGDTVIEMETEERKFDTTLSALIEFKADNTTVKTLGCQATDPWGQTLTIQLMAKIESKASINQNSLLALSIVQVLVVWLYIF